MKKDRTVILARVDSQTQDTIKSIAKSLGYVYAAEGSIGKFLDGIANEEVIVIGKK